MRIGLLLGYKEFRFCVRRQQNFKNFFILTRHNNSWSVKPCAFKTLSKMEAISANENVITIVAKRAGVAESVLRLMISLLAGT